MTIVRLLAGPAPTRMAGSVPAEPGPVVLDVDAYDLLTSDGEALVFGADAITIASGCDQILLERKKERFTDFVRRGGRVLVNGHVVRPFIEGLALWYSYDYRGPSDLRLQALAPHPILEGVDMRDLHFRTGVPGVHCYEELRTIGVAGFYGRGYHPRLPDEALAVTGLGAYGLPLDYSYRLGAGEVFVHGGNDLEGFADSRYSTSRMAGNLDRWLQGAPA